MNDTVIVSSYTMNAEERRLLLVAKARALKGKLHQIGAQLVELIDNPNLATRKETGELISQFNSCLTDAQRMDHLLNLA